MTKYVVGAMAFILVVVGGYYLFKGSGTVQGPVATTTPEEIVPTTATYASSTYSVSYPVAFAIDPNFENTSVSATKPIGGVKFTIPMSMATGTNLSADSFVSIEQLPRAKNCTGDIYLAQNVKATSVSDNGVTYSVATSSDAAAGNRYEEIVFAISGSDPCTAVRYFIHSTAIENYPAGTVSTFDRVALLNAFDSIRTSLLFKGQGDENMQTATTSSTNSQ